MKRWMMYGSILLLFLFSAFLVLSAPQQSPMAAAGGNTAACPDGWTTYVVQPGDTLSGLSVRYNVPLDTLMNVNHIGYNDCLCIGQTICVPALGPTATPVPVTPCIEGHKIDDRHRPLSGWVIHAQNGGGSELITTTDANGHFRFDVVPGTWTLWEDLPAGWEPVTAPRFQVTVPENSNKCVQVRFKNRRLACIDGYKKDNYDYGLPGWVINVQQHGGSSQVITATTNGLGYYRIDNLPPGTWDVWETQEEGWASIKPPHVVVDLQSPSQIGKCHRIDFENKQATPTPTPTPTATPTPIRGCIDGYKVNDDHIGMGGWTIHARPNAGGEEFTAVTDQTGYFKFDSLPLGDWTLSEDLQPGWATVTPGEFEVPVTRPGVCERVRFKNRSPDVCIEVVKQDEQGNKLPGWTFSAKPKESSQPVYTKATGNDGTATFSGLYLGTWTVTEAHQPGWQPISPSSQDVELSTGDVGTCKTITFTNHTPVGCITVHKVDYYDGAGLPNWVVNAQKLDGSGPVLTGMTDGTGVYTFSNVPTGNWKVWEVQKDGWGPVHPSPRFITVVAKDNPECVQVTFQNWELDTPPGDPPASYSCRAYYTVRPGDALSIIAARNGTNTNSLAAANHLANPNFIWVGQKLCIP